MNSFPIEFSSRLSSDTFRHRAPRHCQRTVTIAMFSDGFSRRLFIESMSQSCTPCRRHPFDCQRLIMKRHAHDLQSKTHSRLEKIHHYQSRRFNTNATIGAKFLLQLFFPSEGNARLLVHSSISPVKTTMTKELSAYSSTEPCTGKDVIRSHTLIYLQRHSQRREGNDAGSSIND